MEKYVRERLLSFKQENRLTKSSPKTMELASSQSQSTSSGEMSPSVSSSVSKYGAAEDRVFSLEQVGSIFTFQIEYVANL